MTPEAESYLAKPRVTLDHGRTMLTVNLAEDAGRAAYLAGYQAAQALIFQRTGKAAKIHKGAQTEFARLAVKEPPITADLRRFPSQAYDLKAIFDYELGPDAVVPHEKVQAALETAARFVDCITGLLTA